MKANDLIKKEPVAALLVGGLIGGGAALLLAPKSGRQLRQGLSAFASDVRGTVQCYASQAKDAAVSTVRKGRDYVIGGKELIAGSLEAGRKAYVQEWHHRAKQF